MDDYVFLIIAVVISIFAAIKKNKKKEDVMLPNQTVPNKTGNTLLDQILGEDFLAEPEDIEPVVLTKQVLKKEPLVVATPMRTPGNYKSTFKSSLPVRPSKNIQTITQKNIPEVMPEVEEIGAESSYLEDFSLRKAVIYSEIMNRKYT